MADAEAVAARPHLSIPVLLALLGVSSLVLYQFILHMSGGANVIEFPGGSTGATTDPLAPVEGGTCPATGAMHDFDEFYNPLAKKGTEFALGRTIWICKNCGLTILHSY